jgi:hypothetical protein
VLVTESFALKFQRKLYGSYVHIIKRIVRRTLRPMNGETIYGHSVVLSEHDAEEKIWNQAGEGDRETNNLA